MPTPDFRPPARAGSFYPATSSECIDSIATCREQAVQLPKTVRGVHVFGGVVPHAGWIYSGPSAAAVFEALVANVSKPETIVFFATAHRSSVRRPSLQRSGTWCVPNGDLLIDAELASAMLEEGQARGCLTDQPSAHDGDHAIEVQLPFLVQMLPGAHFVPVAMPHTNDGPSVGAATARAAQKLGRRVVALASTDLTHYGADYYGWAPKGSGMGAHRWCKEVNDRRYLDRLLALDASGANAAGEEDGSACGPAAGAAAAAFARACGASKGILLEHITSWERAKQGQGAPTDFVGYAAMVFV